MRAAPPVRSLLRYAMTGGRLAPYLGDWGFGPGGCALEGATYVKNEVFRILAMVRACVRACVCGWSDYTRGRDGGCGIRGWEWEVSANGT